MEYLSKIQYCCPCFLMSPLSVAQYLEPTNDLFDLVVFDEASQLETCKAVGVIARGKNAVIVGDPKQMPPTNFFASNYFDEENATLEDLKELELCYAPTFNTAKGVENIAALVGLNILYGKVKQVHVSDVRALVTNDCYVGRYSYSFSTEDYCTCWKSNTW